MPGVYGGGGKLARRIRWKKFLNSSTSGRVGGDDGGDGGGSVVDILLCKSIISRNAHGRANFPGATRTLINSFIIIIIMYTHCIRMRW